MKKTVLTVLILVLTTLTYATATARAGTTNTTSEASEPEYRVPTARALNIVPVGTSFDGKELRLHAVTIYVPREWRLLSVSHGKKDWTYLVTMDMRGVDSDQESLQTFTLDLQNQWFLEFVAKFLNHRHFTLRKIENEMVTLEADFQIFWKTRPSEKLAMAK